MDPVLAFRMYARTLSPGELSYQQQSYQHFGGVEDEARKISSRVDPICAGIAGKGSRSWDHDGKGSPFGHPPESSLAKRAGNTNSSLGIDNLGDLGCAMIAVFGHKFQTEDLRISLERFGVRPASQANQRGGESPGSPLSDESSVGTASDDEDRAYGGAPYSTTSSRIATFVLDESGFLALVDERQRLFRGVADELYRCFSSLDVRGCGQLSAADLVASLSSAVSSTASLSSAVSSSTAGNNSSYTTKFDDHVLPGRNISERRAKVASGSPLTGGSVENRDCLARRLLELVTGDPRATTCTFDQFDRALRGVPLSVVR